MTLDVYSFVTDRVRGRQNAVRWRILSGGACDGARHGGCHPECGRQREGGCDVHDEGFGSLDEESRTRAVQVLQELSGGRRLIGIISHVTELKEEMGHKLVVKKGNGGSQVHWEIED